MLNKINMPVLRKQEKLGKVKHALELKFIVTKI